VNGRDGIKKSVPVSFPGGHGPGTIQIKVNRKGIVSMQQDPRKTISGLAGHILSRPGMIDYLQSRQFTGFCRDHDSEDAWNEALQYSMDKPELYGDAVVKHALLMMLRHLYSSRHEGFPDILAALLADFSVKYPGAEFVSGITRDLILLNYPEKEMESLFSKTWK
jgi:hypothetical protein